MKEQTCFEHQWLFEKIGGDLFGKVRQEDLGANRSYLNILEFSDMLANISRLTKTRAADIIHHSTGETLLEYSARVNHIEVLIFLILVSYSLTLLAA